MPPQAFPQHGRRGALLAAYPVASLKRVKYWPPVARVDNVYGDKHVFCTCPPIEAYQEEETATPAAAH